MGLIPSMNLNHVGMGMMVAGAGLMATSFMASDTPTNFLPPGTPQAAGFIGGIGLAGIGFAFSVVEPPK